MIEQIVAIICFAVDRFLKYDIAYGKKIFGSVPFSGYKSLYDTATYLDFSQVNKFILYIMIISVLIGLLFLFALMQKRQMPGVYLLFAGGLSNLADRLWYGVVIDYMQLSCFPVRFALFNIADVLIIIGATMFLFAILKRN
jgi:signal peptidase II